MIESAAHANERARFAWVDATRGIGILLVFYGHVLQKGFGAGNASAADQLRFIYSFHMPLFFVLAGFFYRPTRDILGRLRQLALRRLLPVVFFSLLLLPIWMRDERRSHLPLLRDMLQVGVEYLQGRPELNWVMWFLVCLFVCEGMALVALRVVGGSKGQVVLGLACVLGGVVLCNESSSFAPGLAYSMGRTWFFNEAVVGLGLYAIGHALFPRLGRLNVVRALALFGVSTAIVLATFRLNRSAGDEVIMAAGQHGVALDFALTALAGSAAVISLGVLLARTQVLRTLGRNTLPLLGLNGVFFHYIDPKLARVWHIPDSPGLVLLASTFVTALSLLACAPAVVLMNRYIPQLIGRSAQDGPLLPALERRSSASV